MTIDIKYFQNKLEKEKVILREDLSRVARRNPDNPVDWEAVPAERDASQADENILADRVEKYTENNAIVNQLEPRLKDVREALEKIEKGEYGFCEICHKEIEPDRLEANPAARTCKEHMN